MNKYLLPLILLTIVWSGFATHSVLAADNYINPDSGYNEAYTGPSGGCSQITNFSSFVDCLRDSIIQPLVYLIFGLAIVYFLAGVLKYVRSAGSEDDRRDGRNMMIYGVIAIAVMVSVWGLVNLVTTSFPLTNIAPQPPTFQ